MKPAVVSVTISAVSALRDVVRACGFICGSIGPLPGFFLNGIRFPVFGDCGETAGMLGPNQPRTQGGERLNCFRDRVFFMEKMKILWVEIMTD